MENNFKSSLILTKEEGSLLTKMIGTESIVELLYRATKDGFQASSFHSKCDQKEKTVTIIKNSSNHVFGGFTRSKWTSGTSLSRDPDAFIFSLRRNGVLNNVKLNVTKPSQSYAIFSLASSGPIFGYNVGFDFSICNEADKYCKSSANIGQSYDVPEGYILGSDDTKNYLAGEDTDWLVIEIEVYQII